jgi:transcriptional regulator with XRE-family HTH domain
MTTMELNLRPFGVVVRDLLIQSGKTTGMGNPNWAGFVDELEGISYETLRKAVTSERAPSPKVMEAVAKALDVEPDTFYEYQLAKARAAFDPAEVGEATAFANLQAWIKASKKR